MRWYFDTLVAPELGEDEKISDKEPYMVKLMKDLKTGRKWTAEV